MNRPKIIKELFHPKGDKSKILASIKQGALSIGDFNKKIRPALSHPFTKHVLDSKALPKTLNELKSIRPIYTSDNLAGEIGWLLASIISHQNTLINFSELKEKFELEIITGEYEEAEKVLSKIESEICYSIWSIESRFLLEELKGGSDANWDVLNKISSEIDNPFLLFQIENFSKRVESKFSYTRFRDYFTSKIEGINSQAFAEYLCFRLNYASYEGYESFFYYLSVESNSSIIDRYLVLIDALVELGRNDIEKNKDILKESCEIIQSHFSDNRIQNLYSLVSGNFFKQKSTEQFIELIDIYTSGDFKKSKLKSIELISKEPLSIESYEIYIKSIIELNEKPEKLGKSDSVNNILKNLYELISRGSKLQDAIVGLLKETVRLQSFSFGKQLLGLVNNYTSRLGQNIDYSFLFAVNSKYNNPRLLAHFGEESIKSIWKDEFQSKFKNKSIQLHSRIIEGDFEAIHKMTSVAPARMPIYYSRALYKGGEYERLIEFLESLDITEYSILFEEERSKLLYSSYLQESRLLDAVKLYVSNHFKNESLNNRLNSKILLEQLEKKEFENVKEAIETPVFTFIANADEYTQFVAYDNYLTSRKKSKPSEFTDEIENDTNEVLICFLRDVCKVNVMQYSIEYDGLDDVESERQKLLRILLSIDNENEDEYIKEIAELTQSVNVRNAIRAVNQGRITINVDQLKSKESGNVKEGFLRYQELTKYTELNEGVKGVDVTTDALRQYIKHWLDEQKQNKDDIINDPSFISFKVLFLDLRDKFLLSKEYGLDGYLSTRIRHGTLENHIRSIFENHNLISEKNSDGEYNNIQHWANCYNGNTSTNDVVQKELKKLSSNVDSIVQYIIQELIQVYTDKYDSKPKALFNYNFSQEYLWILYSLVKENVTNHDEFLDKAFDELIGHTEILLKDARKLFKTQLLELFIKELDTLQDNLSKRDENCLIPELSTALLGCRTKIQDELEKISEWFALSNPSTNIITDVMTTMRTGVEITNSISPNHQINPTYNILELPLRGALHIIYITRILLDNIIKHSGQTGSLIDVNIGAELVDNELLRLSFENQITETVSSEDLENTLREVKSKWRDKTNFEMSNVEGGSGFEKIRRILAFDIKGKNYGFDYSIENRKVTIMIDIDIIIQEHETEDYTS